MGHYIRFLCHDSDSTNSLPKLHRSSSSAVISGFRVLFLKALHISDEKQNHKSPTK